MSEWKLIIEEDEAYWELVNGSHIIQSDKFKVDLEVWSDE